MNTSANINNNDTLFNEYAGLLILNEVGLGGLLHAALIPFRGHFLAFHQGILLRSYCLKNGVRFTWNPFKMSLSAGVLKICTGPGKKIAPMLAISLQGLLFNLCIFLFGNNQLGFALGMIFLNLFPIVWPILTASVLFGISLQISLKMIIAAICLKLLLFSLYFFGKTKNKDLIQEIFKKFPTLKMKAVNIQNTTYSIESMGFIQICKITLSDLLRIYFIIPYVISILFQFYKLGNFTIQTVAQAPCIAFFSMVVVRIFLSYYRRI